MFGVMIGRAIAAVRTLAALAAACPAGLALAQERVAPRPSATPQVVEQGVADRDSLGRSLRVQSVDLSPHGFERVYQVPGRDDLLMRTNGALYAVFTQSSYARDPKVKTALRAVVPAATVFYIGRPDFRTIRSSGVRDLSFAVNDAPRKAAAPGSLDSVRGVQRIDAATVDGRSANPGAVRFDARIDGRPSGPRGPSEAQAPADARPADLPTHPIPPAPRPPASAPADDARESSPAFQHRIDELMRRARKAQ